jgi:hypothetical protein
LEEREYEDVVDFLQKNELTVDGYYDVIRASIRRPTLVFQRDMTQIMTNTFNPFICRSLRANSDLQIILDEYSCAAYVVDYVNKSNRGISHLHRELLKVHEEHPELSEDDLMKKVAVKMLNAVEMSAQEAAWYLLRQPMSHSSRSVVYIPTVWPQERQKSRKSKRQMDLEGLDDASTDVWLKGPIQRYEERPAELDEVYLAEFMAWYTPINARRSRPVENDDYDDDDADQEVYVNDKNLKYRRRDECRVIRYRTYEVDDVVNYKREMVLLYVPFRSEVVHILDRNKFINIFDENEDIILERCRLYNGNINIKHLIEELRLACEQEDVKIMEGDDSKVRFEDEKSTNNDDIEQILHLEVYRR